jgi:hypothetical protein
MDFAALFSDKRFILAAIIVVVLAFLIYIFYLSRFLRTKAKPVKRKKTRDKHTEAVLKEIEAIKVRLK